MDTSKKYIAMCRAATEIQVRWNPVVHDVVKPDNFYVGMVVNEIELDGLLSFGCIGNTYRESCIWLPRYDQIQEMFADVFGNLENRMAFNFMSFLVVNTQESIEYYNLFNTMEQFLLAYIMDHAYRKAWVDTKWVKINGT